MKDFDRLLSTLTTGSVEFIVIGGFAATAHGSAHVTVDLDLTAAATSTCSVRPVAAVPTTLCSRDSELRTVFGLQCRFVDLPTLIHLKRAAGRPKDLERIAELEALRAANGG